MTKFLFATIFFITSFLSQAQQPTCEWVKMFGAQNATIEFSGSCIDNKGNIYITGYFSGEIALSSTCSIKTTDLNTSNIFILKCNSTGDVVWAKQFDNKNIGSATGKKIKVDSKGNVYLSTTFTENISLKINSEIKEYHSAGQEDVLVIKLNSKGSVLWAKQFGTNEKDDCSIDIDKTDNLYVGGTFLSNINFNKSAATELDGKRPSINIFVLKLNSQGSILWAKRMPSENISFCSDIKITPVGDILLTGAIHSKTDFDPGIDSFLVEPTYPGTVEAYLLKLSSDGTFIWGQQLQSTYSFGLSVTTDDSNFIYCAGVFQDFITVDSVKLFTKSPEGDSYFMKLNSNGKLIYMKNTFATHRASASSIAVDQQNNSYFSGIYSDTIDYALQATPPTQPYTKEYMNSFVFKLNEKGEVIWHYTIGNQFTLAKQPNILLTKNDALFITGNFLGDSFTTTKKTNDTTMRLYIMKLKQ